jgi:nucleoside-diphosphate-sugar epimerase
MRMGGTVLVLGASGNFGARAAEAFAAAGWQVRRYRRGTDMVAAAKGADVIVNALNPPKYHAWEVLIPQITEQVIAAGLASGAAILMVGNVYVYGDQPGPWGPDTPHRPVSRKGAVRARMEAAYRAATERGLRVILLRGGDFLDPTSDSTILRMVVLKGLARGRMVTMGDPAVPRAYAWLPDMARAAVALAERRADLPSFADIPFAGLTLSFNDMRAGFERLTGRPVAMGRFGWWQMRLLAPLWELARELLEMRYLYETPHSLDPAQLTALVPGFRGVDFDTVLRSHLPAPVVQGRAMSTQTGR